MPRDPLRDALRRAEDALRERAATVTVGVERLRLVALADVLRAEQNTQRVRKAA